MRSCLIAVAVLLLLLGVAPPGEGECTCNAARETNGWCKEHEVGYVGSVPVKSRWLFDALDAHGHDVDHSTFKCPTCRQAIASDGFCELHRVGFVAGQAYFSKLTHHLAKGRVRQVEEIACPVCRKNAETHGWCEDHQVGMVGPVEIKDRGEFEELSEAIHILHLANEAAERCEYCAVAIITDTQCPVCKISYKDGKEVPPAP